MVQLKVKAVEIMVNITLEETFSFDMMKNRGYNGEENQELILKENGSRKKNKRKKRVRHILHLMLHPVVHDYFFAPYRSD